MNSRPAPGAQPGGSVPGGLAGEGEPSLPVNFGAMTRIVR